MSSVVHEQGGLAAAARSQLKAHLAQSMSLGDRWRHWLGSLSRPPFRSLLVLVCAYFLGLGIAAIGTNWWNPTVASSVSPIDGSDGLLVVWQVQAALVGIALPFLFVLMPLVRTEELAVTRTTYLLLEKTLIAPILVFSLAGVVWIGIAAVWLKADGPKWIAIFGFLVPTVAGVGYAYLQSARVLADPRYVRDESMPLLLRLVDESVIEQSAIEFANGALLEIAGEVNLEWNPLQPLPGGSAVVLAATQSGIVEDVDGSRLRRVLRPASRRPPIVLTPSATGFSGALPTGSPVADGTSLGYLHFLIGDSIRTGDPLVSFPGLQLSTSRVDSLQAELATCLTVVPDG